MKNFVLKTAINAVALWVAAFVVSGIHLGADGKPWTSKLVTIVLVALLFGLVNAILGPIARFLSFPARVLTLGLFTFVVNAFLLQVTEWISDPLGLAFTIDKFFWNAVFAAAVAERTLRPPASGAGVGPDRWSPSPWCSGCSSGSPPIASRTPPAPRPPGPTRPPRPAAATRSPWS